MPTRALALESAAREHLQSLAREGRLSAEYRALAVEAASPKSNL